MDSDSFCRILFVSRNLFSYMHLPFRLAISQNLHNVVLTSHWSQSRKDAAAEKIIAIYGRDSNSTAIACQKILEVMKDEGEKLNKGELCLKILAHNNFVGRIIGKNGRVINDIKEKTNTRISVSSIYDMNSFSLDRTITISGSIEDMSTAQSRIYEILRQSSEQDYTTPIGTAASSGVVTPAGGVAPISGGSSYAHQSAVQPMGFSAGTPSTPRSPYSVMVSSVATPGSIAKTLISKSFVLWFMRKISK